MIRRRNLFARLLLTAVLAGAPLASAGGASSRIFGV